MREIRPSVGSRELETRLGTYLRMVQSGTRILVTERGRPIAELVPLEARGNDVGTKLEALERQGRLTRATRADLPDHEPEELRGVPIAQTLIEAREDRF